MGWSNTSFEINKSEDKKPEENGDDYIIGLMKRRLIEDKDKEIEIHELNKIKELDDYQDSGKNEEINSNENKISLKNNIEDNDIISQILIIQKRII